MRRIVAIVLAVVFVLLVGAELAVRPIAAHRIATAAKCAPAGRDHGAVHGSASGFPLTYPLLVHRSVPHAHVTTTASGSDVSVDLDDVHLRHGLTARRAVVDVRVPWSAMREQLPDAVREQYGDDLRLSADGDLLAANLSVLATTVRLDYTVTVEDGAIVLTPAKAVAAGLSVPIELVRTMTGGAFAEALKTRRIEPDLPLPATLDSARVTESGLRLHLTLGPDALARFAGCV